VSGAVRAERPKLSSYRPSLDRQLEQEADEAAREVVAGRTAPAAATAGAAGEGVQRKCGCGSAGSCECGVQRLEMGGGLLGAASELLGRARDAVFGAGLLVEDGEVAGAGQMQRSAFLGALRATVCRAADAELREVGRDTEGCPYIAHWLARLGGRSARDLERATLLYARPSVRTVDGLLAALAERTAEAVRAWKRTGSVPDLPAELPAGEPEPVQRLAAPGASGSAEVASVRSRLGPGHPLPGSVRSRMESGFGTSFSQVRLHTDTAAASLAAEQGAIALTVGQDVVLGPQAGAPGSVPGDLVLAHELAHTIQQRGGSGAAGGSHERDADQAAAGVVLGQGGRPALSSGLALQGCRPNVKRCPPGMRWGRAANASSAGAGSFGCTCVYRCMADPTLQPEGPMLCPASGCTPVQTVGTDYVFERNGQVERAPVSERAAPGEQAIGWGGASTPIGAQAACLCPGVDIEGEETVEAAHMEPIALQLADLHTGPRNRLTGVPLANVDANGRRVDPIRAPAIELVLRPQQPAQNLTAPVFGSNFFQNRTGLLAVPFLPKNPGEQPQAYQDRMVAAIQGRFTGPLTAEYASAIQAGTLSPNQTFGRIGFNRQGGSTRFDAPTRSIVFTMTRSLNMFSVGEEVQHALDYPHVGATNPQLIMQWGLAARAQNRGVSVAHLRANLTPDDATWINNWWHRRVFTRMMQNINAGNYGLDYLQPHLGEVHQLYQSIDGPLTLEQILNTQFQGPY
jgi:hypothetical protein